MVDDLTKSTMTVKQKVSEIMLTYGHEDFYVPGGLPKM